MQNIQASRKDKDAKESKQEEQYDEGDEDPLEGDDQKKVCKNVETNQVVTKKRKVHTEASTRRKKKQKIDKTKGIILVVLNDVDLGQIGDTIQEETMESCNTLEDLYATLLTSVEEFIAELKILAQMVRQPVHAEENLQDERLIEPTLAV